MARINASVSEGPRFLERASALATDSSRSCSASERSAISFDTAFLEDVTATTNANSTDTSSSSLTWLSRASASSSPAIENEIETERSEPTEPSALAMPRSNYRYVDYTTKLFARPPLPKPPLAFARPEVDCSNPIAAARQERIAFEDVKRACDCEQRLFDRPLLRRQAVHAYLSVRMCFLTKDTQAFPSESRKRARRDVVSHHGVQLTHTTCRGAVFGVTFATLVAYLTLSSTPIVEVVRTIHRALQPVASALKYIDGFDLHTLCAGIASHRIDRFQLGLLSSSEPKRRSGSKCRGSAVVGACAAVYCVYRTLADQRVGGTRDDVDFLLTTDSLEKTLAYALNESEGLFAKAVAPGGREAMAAFEVAALDVEERAFERASVAVRTARRYAAHFGMAAYATLDLTLTWYRKAAWPAGMQINERTQLALLERFRHPAFLIHDIDYDSLPKPESLLANSSVPLSELRGTSAEGTWESDGSSRNSSTNNSTMASSNASSLQDCELLSQMGDMFVGT